MRISFFLLLIPSTLPSSAPPQQPQFPEQFSTQIIITSNLLPDDGPSYPPRERHINLSYSTIQQAATIEISKGYEAGKTYTRHYKTKYEYMVKSGKYPSCQRSHLLEPMSPPSLPHLVYIGKTVIEGIATKHYVHEIANGIERAHVYFLDDDATPNPRRLVHEDIGADGEVTTLMTYDFINFVAVGEDQDFAKEGVFNLPSEYNDDPRVNCERHVGGWGWIHLFHHYLKV